MNTNPATTGRLVVFVGSYAGGPANGPGGIDVLKVSADGTQLEHVGRADGPEQAGYLAYSPSLSALYAVDERKTDGRGPVGPAAAVHAFRVSQDDGTLTRLNSLKTVGPFPTFVNVSDTKQVLVSANHGSFEHIEHIVKTEDGWDVEYLYDHSSVVLYDLEPDGSVARIADVKVYTEGGADPNTAHQAGGHGQASAHAHCAVIDPSGEYVVVCDKGADHITVFALRSTLEQVSRLDFPHPTGPRHVAFDPRGTRAYVDTEFSSALLSLDFDPATGQITLVDEVSTVAEGFADPNEPADVRVHPNGRFVYVNNRGEDTLALFHAGANGELRRTGATKLTPSPHSGLAPRSFVISPDGSFLLLADRPANLVRSYAIDQVTGSLEQVATAEVADPASLALAELS